MLAAEVKPTFTREHSTFLVCVALSQVVGFAGKMVSSMHTTGNCSNLPKVLDPCHWDLTKVGLMVPPLCPFMDLLGDTKRIVMQSFNKTIEVNLCAAKWQLVKKLA